MQVAVVLGDETTASAACKDIADLLFYNLGKSQQFAPLQRLQKATAVSVRAPGPCPNAARCSGTPTVFWVVQPAPSACGQNVGPNSHQLHWRTLCNTALPRPSAMSRHADQFFLVGATLGLAVVRVSQTPLIGLSDPI